MLDISTVVKILVDADASEDKGVDIAILIDSIDKLKTKNQKNKLNQNIFNIVCQYPEAWHIDVFSKIISYKEIELNLLDANGFSGIHYMMSTKHRYMNLFLEKLVAAGLNINIAAKNGKFAFDVLANKYPQHINTTGCCMIPYKPYMDKESLAIINAIKGCLILSDKTMLECAKYMLLYITS